MKTKRKPKPATGEAWGILNPYGDMWTYDTFPTPEEAMAYVKRFWSAPGFGPTDLSKFQPVRVKVRVSPLPPPPSKEG